METTLAPVRNKQNEQILKREKKVVYSSESYSPFKAYQPNKNNPPTIRGSNTKSIIHPNTKSSLPFGVTILG